MSNVFYMVLAYTVIWMAVLVYLVRLGGMRRKLEARLARVEDRIRDTEHNQ